eukprot:gene9574-biopygen2516
MGPLQTPRASTWFPWDANNVLHTDPADYNVRCYAPQHGYDPRSDGPTRICLYNPGNYNSVPLWPKVPPVRQEQKEKVSGRVE